MLLSLEKIFFDRLTLSCGCKEELDTVHSLYNTLHYSKNLVIKQSSVGSQFLTMEFFKGFIGK